MLDQNDRDFEIFLYFSDQSCQFRSLLRIHAGSRLIQEKNFRVSRQGADDFQTALLAVRKIFRQNLIFLFQFENGQQFQSFFAHFGFLAVISRRAQQAVESILSHSAVHRDQYIIENRQFLEETDVLECTRQAEVRNFIRCFPVQEHLFIIDLQFDRSCCRDVDARQQVEEGRFASTIRADQTDQFIFFDHKIDIGYCSQTAEIFRQFFYF
ncbi:hypothetical protein SDC9_89584 [bioreactor metagenome]|uniref:Uncharacterized protein n=1 Tax=bioreactor metagenome TaxID=1076179 RepID=A0A644ZPY6_9ZZZZ